MSLDIILSDNEEIRGNVLVVEDIDKQRKSLVKALDKRGLKVKSAKTGTGGLKICDKDPIDVVVLDYQDIGRLDGIEVAQRLQIQHPSILVIAHTAFGTTYRPQADQLGLENIVEWVYKKPKSIEVVIDNVFKLLIEKFQMQARRWFEGEYSNPSMEGSAINSITSISYTQNEIINDLKHVISDLKRPEVYHDLQQRQIQIGLFKMSVRTRLWQAYSTSTQPQRNLVHMLKIVIARFNAANITEDQISALDNILDLLDLDELSPSSVSQAKSLLQSVNLDPILRVGKELESLKRMYWNTELNLNDGEDM